MRSVAWGWWIVGGIVLLCLLILVGGWALIAWCFQDAPIAAWSCGCFQPKTGPRHWCTEHGNKRQVSCACAMCVWPKPSSATKKRLRDRDAIWQSAAVRKKRSSGG